MNRVLLAAAFALGLLASAATAAQDDPRLDPLFERLAATDDEAEAAVLESMIWSFWTDAHDARLNQLMIQGMHDMQVGDFEAAVAAFSTLIEIAPEFAEGWNKRATVYYMSGRLDLSTEDCMEVLAREPRHFGALSGLGLIHEAKGDMAAALDWYRRALQQNPHMPLIAERVQALEIEVEGEPI